MKRHSHTRQQLALQLDLPTDLGKRDGLVAALRSRVEGGELPPGTSLPSSRTLAEALCMARATVVQAYEQLIAEGLFESRARAGTVVGSRIGSVPHTLPASPLPARTSYSFLPGLVSPDLFPQRQWMASMREAFELEELNRDVWPEAVGEARLRRALVRYLSRVHGVDASPSRVIITAGYRDALAVIASALQETGRSNWAMEPFGLSDHCRIVTDAGASVAFIRQWNDSQWHEPPASSNVLALTPGSQFPLGGRLSPGARADYIQWADRTDAYIVEDDYDGDLLLDRWPHASMQREAPHRIIYAGTASKALSPTLRVGWIVVPPALLSVFTKTVGTRGQHVPTSTQLALSLLIESGRFDRHVMGRRQEYKRRRNQLLLVLEPYMLSVPESAVGTHLTVRFNLAPKEHSCLAAFLKDEGVLVRDVSLYARSVSDKDWGLVIGYGSPSRNKFSAGLDALRKGLARYFSY